MHVQEWTCSGTHCCSWKAICITYSDCMLLRHPACKAHAPYCCHLWPVLFGHWHSVAQLVKALRYKPEIRRFHSRWCHWHFSLTKSFRPDYGTMLDSASNRNEYQDYFFLGGGVKAARAKGWQIYHFQVLIVMKSGSLRLLEPSAPVQGLFCLFSSGV